MADISIHSDPETQKHDAEPVINLPLVTNPAVDAVNPINVNHVSFHSKEINDNSVIIRKDAHNPKSKTRRKFTIKYNQCS